MNDRILKWEFAWDDTYENPRTEILTTRYFQQVDGWSNEEIGRIVMLEVGESLQFDDGHITVKRVQ